MDKPTGLKHIINAHCVDMFEELVTFTAGGLDTLPLI